MFKPGDRVVLDMSVSVAEFKRIGIKPDDPFWDWFFYDELEVRRVYGDGDISVQNVFTPNGARKSARVGENMVKLEHVAIDETKKLLMEIKEECGIS